MLARLFLFLSLIVVLFFFLNTDYIVSGFKNAASVFSKIFEEKISPEDLLQKYEKERIKILIIPGHDNVSIGAQFKNLKETDLALALTQNLIDFFGRDAKFEVFTTRDKNGEYEKWFSDYLIKNQAAIKTFRDYFKSVLAFLAKRGEFKKEVKIHHLPAADNMSLNLYAINKWANDNNVDIVLHVHFNDYDYPARTAGQPGKYSGFAIYVPEKQLPNYRTSLALANSVKERLEKYFSKSNFSKETNTIIEDQQLIAVGSNASRKGASFLIEYGYIYETQFLYPEARAIIFKNMAEQTYLGVKGYFENH